MSTKAADIQPGDILIVKNSFSTYHHKVVRALRGGPTVWVVELLDTGGWYGETRMKIYAANVAASLRGADPEQPDLEKLYQRVQSADAQHVQAMRQLEQQRLAGLASILRNIGVKYDTTNH